MGELVPVADRLREIVGDRSIARIVAIVATALSRRYCTAQNSPCFIIVRRCFTTLWWSAESARLLLSCGSRSAEASHEGERRLSFHH